MCPGSHEEKKQLVERHSVAVQAVSLNIQCIVSISCLIVSVFDVHNSRSPMIVICVFLFQANFQYVGLRFRPVIALLFPMLIIEVMITAHRLITMNVELYNLRWDSLYRLECSCARYVA